MSERNYRRRIVVVDKKFQLGISGRIVMYLAAYFIFFFMLAVFAPFLGSVLEGASHDETSAALTDLVRFSNRMFVPLLLTFVCLALHTVLLTHRIAGPVYRFKKMFEGIRNGELAGDVRLRKGDFLMGLAEAYNISMTKLRSDFDELRAEAEGLVAEEGTGAEAARLRGERMLRILDHYETGTYEAEDASAPAEEAQREEQVVAES
jgi:hypothetical protein